MKLTLHTTTGDIELEEKHIPPPNIVVRDVNLKVPGSEHGQFVQILDDTAVLGAPRQIVNNMVEKFDFPAVVNKKWGLRTRYPGYFGTEYDYVTLPTDFCFLKYELTRYASSYRLPRGNISGYYKTNDEGLHVMIDSVASSWWVWTELIVDGKSHTDGPNVEQWGRCDPVTGRNMGAQNFAWLMRPFTGALIRIVEDRGNKWGYEVLDVTKSAPSLDYVLDRPWLYCWGVTQTRTKIGQRYATDDYPQIAQAFRAIGLPRTGTPILNMGKGNVSWIDKSACSPILEPGSSWSPYFPEKM